MKTSYVIEFFNGTKSDVYQTLNSLLGDLIANGYKPNDVMIKRINKDGIAYRHCVDGKYGWHDEDGNILDK